jgi:hypothetical protein
VSRKSIQAQTASLLLVVLLFGPATGNAGPPGASPVRSDDLSKIGIDNFAGVNDTYYRGAEPDDDDYATLAALGIKTVIDLRSDDADAEDKAFVERAGMRYIQLPMTTQCRGEWEVGPAI